MKKVVIQTAIVVTVLLLAASCAPRKSFVYLSDMVPGEEYLIKPQEEATIQPNDRISIIVECPSKPELAIPFKVQQGSYQVDDQGRITIQRTNGGNENCYVVDEKGYIDFPVIGRYSVEDMTLDEAQEFLAEAITNTGLIRNPSVSVKFMGFKYTVMGAIGGSGTRMSESNKLTLLDVIADEGDLSGRARMNRIGVIREEGGVRKIYYTDLRSKDFFDSPIYYLKPNDIVYVEPKYKKRDFEEGLRYYLSYGMTLLSTFTTLAVLLTKF